MSAETALDTTLTSDLPPRTWHGWWLAWPKWFRIGCWAALGSVLLHLALAVRIFVGLQEPAEMVEMRQRYIGFRFAWQSRQIWDDSTHSTSPEFLSWDQRLISGLHGHSWSNVVEVDMSGRGTDDDLRCITARCPNLEFLSAANTDVSAEAVAGLKRCKHLRELDLSNTDTDDLAVKELAQLKSLSLLKLRETLVGDDGVYAMIYMPMPELRAIDLSYTDTTWNSLYEWRRSFPVVEPIIAIDDTEIDNGTHTVRGSVRWSDGIRSGRFQGANCEFGFLGPLRASLGKSTAFSRSNLTFRFHRSSQTTDEYRFILRVGKFEAKPILIDRKNGQPWPHRIEFEMPCTKAEALRSALSPDSRVDDDE